MYAASYMMSIAALSLSSALLAASPPSVPGPVDVHHDPGPQAIYGGEPVEPGDWPAVVAVNSGKLCTGTLVAPDLVLTAAHCFDAPTPGEGDEIDVYFGDTLASATVLQSPSWGSHPDFCYPSDCGEDISDFAFVRLDNAVTIEPIPVITSQAELDEVMQVGTPLTFVGFGEDESGLLGAGIKREVDASLTALNDSGREFRAGGGGKDTCQGDSGGPALVEVSPGEWRVAGVLSRGGECGGGGVYGVPFPELCWLRDASGVDLLPEGCASCDCVVLPVPEPEKGCGSCELEQAPPGWALAQLLALLGFGALLRRRRGLGVEHG